MSANQKQAHEFLRIMDELSADDKAYIFSVLVAMHAERQGKATAEQAALLAQARREMAEAKKGN